MILDTLTNERSSAPVTANQTPFSHGPATASTAFANRTRTSTASQLFALAVHPGSPDQERHRGEGGEREAWERARIPRTVETPRGPRTSPATLRVGRRDRFRN